MSLWRRQAAGRWRGEPGSATKLGALQRKTIKEAPAPPSEASSPSPDRTRPALPRNAKASPVRRVSGTRALEVRIEAMELQLKQLTEKVSQIAQSGNYLETRRIGEEHAALERSLKELYEEWAKVSEAPKE